MAHHSHDKDWHTAHMPRPIRTSEPVDQQGGQAVSLENLYTGQGDMRHLLPQQLMPQDGAYQAVNNGGTPGEGTESPTRMLLRLLGLAGAGAGVNGYHGHDLHANQANQAGDQFRRPMPGMDAVDYRPTVQLQDFLAMQGSQGLQHLPGNQHLMNDHLAGRHPDSVAAQHHLQQHQHQQAIHNVLSNPNALNAGALGGFNGLPAGALAPGALSAGPLGSSAMLGNGAALPARSGLPGALTTAGGPRSSLDGLLHLFDSNHGLASPAHPPAGLPGQLFSNGNGQVFQRDGVPAASAAVTQDLLLGQNAVATAVRNSGYAWGVDPLGSDGSHNVGSHNGGHNGGEIKAECPSSPGVRAVENGGDDAQRLAEAVQRLAPADTPEWQVPARPGSPGGHSESPPRKSPLRGPDSGGVSREGRGPGGSVPNKHGRRINPRKGIPMHIMATYALLRLPELEGNLSDMSAKIEENAYFCKQLDWTPRPGTKTYPRWKDALVGCFKPGRYPHLKKTNRKKEGLTVYALVKNAIPDKSCLKPSHLTDVDPASLPADFDINNPLVPLRNVTSRSVDKQGGDATSVVTTGIQPGVTGGVLSDGGGLLPGMDNSAILGSLGQLTGQLGGHLGGQLGALNGLQGLAGGVDDTAALMAVVQRSHVGNR
eukprot:jgi/Ulvmu1/11267/UM073_0039.1